jgi:hypothetical protein
MLFILLAWVLGIGYQQCNEWTIYSRETSGSIKVPEILNQLGSYRLLKHGSAPCNKSLVVLIKQRESNRPVICPGTTCGAVLLQLSGCIFSQTSRFLSCLLVSLGLIDLTVNACRQTTHHTPVSKKLPTISVASPARSTTLGACSESDEAETFFVTSFRACTIPRVFLRPIFTLWFQVQFQGSPRASFECEVTTIRVSSTYFVFVLSVALAIASLRWISAAYYSASSCFTALVLCKMSSSVLLFVSII